MTKVKKIIILGVAFILLFFLTACEGSEEEMPYNAIMFGNRNKIRTWLKDDFYEENLTYGSWSVIQEKYVEDEKYPQSRTLIIMEEDEFNTVFKEFPVEVDFEKEMVAMYAYTTSSGSECEIANIALNDKTLRIEYKHPIEKGGPHQSDASMPLTKWVVVKMDKINITVAEFIFVV